MWNKEIIKRNSHVRTEMDLTPQTAERKHYAEDENQDTNGLSPC